LRHNAATLIGRRNKFISTENEDPPQFPAAKTTTISINKGTAAINNPPQIQ